MPRVECPKCQEWVDVVAADFGRMVNCGSCGATFPAIEPLENEADFERRAKFERAQRLLRGRSRGLVGVSIVSLIGSCVFGAGYLIAGFQRIWWSSRKDAEQVMLFGIATAVFGSIYSLLVLIGASRMHDPRQRNWPIASAILAAAAILFCWPIPFIHLALSIYGIWALQRLNHPAVREAAAIDGDFASATDPDDQKGTDPQRSLQNYFSDRYDPEDSETRAAVVTEAMRRVRVPGTGLKVTGIIGMMASVTFGIFVTVAQLDGYRNQTENAVISLGTFIAITFYFFLVAAGGRAASRLQHRPLSLTAAVLGVVSIGFCGVWIIVSIPGVIFGTWAFAALNAREVRHAMRWKRAEREERRE